MEGQACIVCCMFWLIAAGCAQHLAEPPLHVQAFFISIISDAIIVIKTLLEAFVHIYI